MNTLLAPSGASGPLVHALELSGREIDNILKKLDTSDQNLFWSEVQRFAAAQIGHKASVPLVAGEHIPELVRQALRDLETQLAKARHGLTVADRDPFWETLRDAAAEQAGEARPKVRAGGGTFQF